MPQERSDPVWLDDVESPPEHRSPRRLCIISGDALPSGEFIAALQTAVGPNQEIEIIRERRRGGSGIGPGQPPIERRRFPHVQTIVKMDGYAIVPLPPSQSRPQRVPDPPMPRPPAIEHRSSEPRPAERVPSARRAFDDDDGDADERELERILQFKQRRRVRIGGRPVVLAALVVVLILLLVQLPALKSLMSRAATPPAERTSAAPQSTQAPAPAAPSSPDRSSKSLPPAGRESAERPPEATVTPRAEVDTTPRPQTSPVPPPQTSPVPRVETTETRRQTGRVTGLPPEPPSRASSRQPAVAHAPETLRGESSRFPGVPRVELTRNSLPTPEGKAESYVVRLSDPAGRPLAGAEVLLLARMADGTVESIMLRDGSEPGTYSGTSRPTPSAPVDLRVRMTLSDKRVEVPLRP
jgi:hypothetical protein